MRIALIGPGILPIPPSGWGAVETVIWNLKTNLSVLGHQVLIVNTTDRKEAKKKLTEFGPQLIWLHYDDYVHWLSDYDRRATFWLTSHFAYIEQYSKPWFQLAQLMPTLGSTPSQLWKSACLSLRPASHRLYAMASYFRILAKTVAIGRTISLSLVCLSPQIQKALRPLDLATKVLPNAAEDDQIHYDRGAGNGRALCLGKIEPRKRQAELLHIDQLDYVGPIKDKRFPVDNPRYKGIWGREEVRNKLTTYSALVLLSDGEAHALVICEALLAGLSLIVSNHAAGNLQPEWPVAKILATEEYTNPQLVKQAVDEMLERAKHQRQQAREIGLKFFSMQKQQQNLKRLIEA